MIERSGRQANLAVLGNQRRRWLERSPRDPNSPHPNRLIDVLSKMVADGVLVKRGAKYVPGSKLFAVSHDSRTRRRGLRYATTQK